MFDGCLCVYPRLSCYVRGFTFVEAVALILVAIMEAVFLYRSQIGDPLVYCSFTRSTRSTLFVYRVNNSGVLKLFCVLVW